MFLVSEAKLRSPEFRSSPRTRELNGGAPVKTIILPMHSDNPETARDRARDVKQGQTLEAKAEAKSSRPRPDAKEKSQLCMSTILIAIYPDTVVIIVII